MPESETSIGSSLITIEPWDPLALEVDEPDLVIAAQRREIRNILKSYTGYYDLFSELLQNALDAVEKRANEQIAGYLPAIWITINLRDELVSVTDNGCAMSFSQFKQFLKPNRSFKDGVTSRGNKGVGATYLAYGFNYLEVATKQANQPATSGVLKNGRSWLDDNAGIVSRPKVESCAISNIVFESVDRGTSITLGLSGDNVRPKSLQYFAAKTAEQWTCLLRAHTPLGGIYLCGETAPQIAVTVNVIAQDGVETSISASTARYLYPHEVLGKTASLKDFLADQLKRAQKGQDTTKIPPKYTGLNGIWGEWTGKDILENVSPINPVLDNSDRALIAALDLQIYVFMCYSTDLWDDYNDNRLKLRKRTRILRGGLQQATKHMPQGSPITIPLTNNIYFQNITQVIVHFRNAEPDLGRKGFQPEQTELAERLAVSAVAAFRRYYDSLLRRNTGAPALMQAMKLETWIDSQKEYEKTHPLIIKGIGLFKPEEELPIRSLPIVEQDVVALFNQMLSAGLIRGVQLLSSSQFNQYDGLYRIRMDPPFTKFYRSQENPLGIDADRFAGVSGTLLSPVRVLEYKYSLDALIEELGTGQKNADDIGLVVCWQIGDKWKGQFDILSYLDGDNVHHREFHGFSHHLSHSASGLPAFPIIALSDVVGYLTDTHGEETRQKSLYGVEIG